MFQITRSLGEIPEENIVYVNPEDRRLQPLTDRSLDQVYEAFIQIAGMSAQRGHENERLNRC